MITKDKIIEVFGNLLNTYKECDSLILSLSFSNEEGKRKSYFGGIRIIKPNIVLSIINITQKELRELEPTIREFKIKYIFKLLNHKKLKVICFLHSIDFLFKII